MAIQIGTWSYSTLGRNALAQRLQAFVALGAGSPTIEYHELGGQGLLCTFVLNNPQFAASGATLTLSVSPEVSAVVIAGITTADPDYYYIKNGNGDVACEGTLAVTAAEQLTTGDIVTFTFAAIDLPT